MRICFRCQRLQPPGVTRCNICSSQCREVKGIEFVDFTKDGYNVPPSEKAN